MDEEAKDPLTDEECEALLDRMFPAGARSPEAAAAAREAFRGWTLATDPEEEAWEVVGRCLWDVFSDNHEVVAPDGRVADLGSFRDSGGFLAWFANARLGREPFDYMTFYMGTRGAAEGPTLDALRDLVFARLRAQAMDWVYSPPRLYAVDLSGLAVDLGLKTEDEARASREETEAMQAGLDEAHRRAVEEARRRPPPPLVASYRRVYGRFPRGWPPEGAG